jgi:hypothetical protein
MSAMRDAADMRPAQQSEAPNGARVLCREAKCADAGTRRLRTTKR